MNERFSAPCPCALGLLLVAGPALAANHVDIGHGVSADWTLKATAGAALRTQSASNDIVFAGNSPYGRSVDGNSDAGDLNYDRGDFVKGSFQAYSSLKLGTKHYGVFVSGQAWEDSIEAQYSVSHGNTPNGYTAHSSLSDRGFDRRAKFAGGTFQQAYAFGNFKFHGHPVKLKAGKQLLLWGRSLFTRGSFSALNAVDLPAYHRPGSGTEQYLIPAGMFTADLGLTQHLDMKAFYQFDWQNTVTDGCGTFFDTFDNVAPGCNATFGGEPTIPSHDALQGGAYFRRTAGHKARGNGQYGVKFNYAFEQQNAHIGAYFFNYHARLPTYSLHRNASPRPAMAPPPFNSATFHFEYPDDIKVYGLTADKTFNDIGNLALNMSYVDGMPLQINAPDLTTETAVPGSDPRIPEGTQAYIASRGPGQDVEGYKRQGVARAELTFTTVIPDLLRANKTVVSAATAFEKIPGLPSKHHMRFGRHTNFGVGSPNSHGYVTDFSWGYQIGAESTYENAIGPVTLKPNLSIRQGVQGYSSDDAFEEHQLTLTGGLGMEYNQVSADVSYTHYNNTKYSTVKDRDYLAFSASYSF